jgi:hypothetical protein
VQLTGGPELRIRTVGADGLDVGDRCRVDLEPASITLWPTGPEPSWEGSLSA